MTDCVDCGKRAIWKGKDGKIRCEDCNTKHIKENRRRRRY